MTPNPSKRRVHWAPSGLILIACIGWATGVGAAESTFEPASDLNAEYLLPYDLLHGEHHKVDERVRNDGYLNYYTIQSSFGEFEAVSTAMLQKLVGEINALAELDKLSKTEVFANAAADAGIKQLKTVQEFATKPVETVKGIPRGIGRMFKRYTRQAEEGVAAAQEFVSGDDDAPASDSQNGNGESNVAADLTESYFGVSTAQRAWARKLGTDPYSSNDVLQAAIKEVAWAERLGRVGMGFAGVPKIPGADIISDVNEAVWSKDPYELRDLNYSRLTETGADEALIEQYLDNKRMTPSQQTLYTAAIAELADVEGRDGMLREALIPENETEMNFLVNSVTLLAWYHINENSVASVNTDSVIPVGTTDNGGTIIVFATDHVFWTETIAAAARRYASAISGEGSREAWFAGSVSDRCRQNLEAMGFEVRTEVTATLAYER